MAWNLIFSIYKSEWDKLIANKNNFTFCQSITAQFKLRENKKKAEISNARKKTKVSKVTPSIPSRPSKKVLEKSKFYQKKGKKSVEASNTKNRQSYVQVLSSNIKEILKIKENQRNP